MANKKGKKSFVLYIDYEDSFLDLTDAEAGVLIKTIFRYCNSEEPEIPAGIRQSFNMIKKDLKRDMDKWEDIREKRSEAGKKHTGNQYTESENGTNGTNVPNVEQNGTNGSVNVNVNVNDNVNVLSKDNNLLLPSSGDSEAAKKVKHKHGKYGWVKLTDDEYKRLVNEYGEVKVNLQIELLDEYVQGNGNKNKYKDWNITLRKSIRDNWFDNKRSNNKDSGFSSQSKTDIVWETL